MKISVEYELNDLSYEQLVNLLLFLRQSNQIDNMRIVNAKLTNLDSIVSRSTAKWKSKEIKKTFWQTIFKLK